MMTESETLANQREVMNAFSDKESGTFVVQVIPTVGSASWVEAVLNSYSPISETPYCAFNVTLLSGATCTVSADRIRLSR